MSPKLQPRTPASSIQGRPLPDFVRSVLEPLFRASFADVGLHIGPEPASIGAKAFVRGSEIYVSGRHFAPYTRSGLRLLAHELAHIRQQRDGRTARHAQQGAGLVDDPALEMEADSMAEEVISRLKTLPSFTSKARGGQQAPIQVLPAVQISEDSYQIAAGNEEDLAGAVLVRKTDSKSVVLNDLEVRPRYRKQGLGRALISAAFATGASLGATKAILVSHDVGTGRLTNWYERLGFTQFGWHSGLPKLVAHIDRVLMSRGSFSPPILGGFVQCKGKKKTRGTPMSLAEFNQTVGPQPNDIWLALGANGTIECSQIYFSQTRAGNRYQEEFQLGGQRITLLEEHVSVLEHDNTNLHLSTPAIDIVFYRGQIMCLTGNRRLYVHKKAGKPIRYNKLARTETQISGHGNVDPEAPRGNLTIS